jgi:hypothetical protein
MRDDAEVVRHAEEVQHVAELVDRARIGMLTTMTESGKHVSQPMALQEVEFDSDLWTRHGATEPDQGPRRLRGVLGVNLEQGAAADRCGAGSGDR